MMQKTIINCREIVSSCHVTPNYLNHILLTLNIICSFLFQTILRYGNPVEDAT